MATQPNIVERNRANAKHSTGPRTPEGKRKVSQNARKLGLFVSDSTVEQEDPRGCPQRGSETELVRQLTAATHRLRRLERIETAALFSDQIAHTRHEASVITMERFEDKAGLAGKIERAERTFTRCYKGLEVRKARRPAPREQPEEIRIEVDSRHSPAGIRRVLPDVRFKPSPPPPGSPSAPQESSM